MSEPDGGRHEIGGVGGSVAEHDALVASAEAVAGVAALGTAHLKGLVDATGDVRALAIKRHRDATGRAIEANTRRVVPDREDLAAHDLRDLNVRLGRHLTGDVNEAGSCHRLDGDTASSASRIASEMRSQTLSG